MDYSKLSDFEINKRVAFCLGAKPYMAKDFEKELSGESVIIKSNFKLGAFDPCNNPEDAWSIIVANKISLHAPRYKEGWMADFTGSDDDVNDGFNVDDCRVQYQSNPLRAAMIVFLMMQGDEK